MHYRSAHAVLSDAFVHNGVAVIYMHTESVNANHITSRTPASLCDSVAQTGLLKIQARVIQHKAFDISRQQNSSLSEPHHHRHP